MIVLDFEGPRRFNFRIVAVFIDEGHVLIHRAGNENFWSLPGGRAEILEPTEETIRREMLEELGLTVTVRRLLWVMENFFTYESIEFHELAFYYLVDLPPDAPYRRKDAEFTRLELNLTPMYFKWVPIAELNSVKLVPSYLQSALHDLPESVRHVVHTDAKDIQTGPSIVD